VPNPTMLPARSQQIPRSIRSAASSMVAFSQPANPARLPTPEPDGRPPQRCAVEAQGVPAKTAHLGSSPIKVGARAERGTREARADSRASYFNHKWPPESEEADKHPRPAGGFLRHAGDVLSLIGIEDDAARRRRRCKREKIRQWSAASRTRLLRVCLALDWDLVGALCMVTLTYPGDRGAAFIARDGITVHRHLRRFLKRWTRRWGKPKGLWKLEFQDRGAPHLHVFLSMPCDVSITRCCARGSPTTGGRSSAAATLITSSLVPRSIRGLERRHATHGNMQRPIRVRSVSIKSPKVSRM